MNIFPLIPAKESGKILLGFGLLTLATNRLGDLLSSGFHWPLVAQGHLDGFSTATMHLFITQHLQDTDSLSFCLT